LDPDQEFFFDRLSIVKTVNVSFSSSCDIFLAIPCPIHLGTE